MGYIKHTKKGEEVYEKAIKKIINDELSNLKKKKLHIFVNDGCFYINQLYERHFSVWWLRIEISEADDIYIKTGDNCVLMVYNKDNKEWFEYFKSNSWITCLEKANADIKDIDIAYDIGDIMYMDENERKELNNIRKFYEKSRIAIIEYHKGKKNKTSADATMKSLLELLEEISEIPELEAYKNKTISKKDLSDFFDE